MCLTLAPTFIKKCLHYDTENSGLLSMFPNIGTMIMYYIAGFSADKMIGAGVKITRVRKLFNALSFILSGATFFCKLVVKNNHHSVVLSNISRILAIGFVHSSQMAVALLTVAVTFS
jgi:hypothetical protein